MDEYLSFRNFRQFERTRREIRLPYDLLNDVRFRQLSDARKAHLLCLLLLAARMDNFLPNHRLKLERLIGATEILDLSELAEFIKVAAPERPSYEDRPLGQQADSGQCEGRRDRSRRRPLSRLPQRRQPANRSHRSAQQRRILGRVQPPDPVPPVQPPQVEEAGAAILSESIQGA
jgi:hypothetical protein